MFLSSLYWNVLTIYVLYFLYFQHTQRTLNMRAPSLSRIREYGLEADGMLLSEPVATVCIRTKNNGSIRILQRNPLLCDQHNKSARFVLNCASNSKNVIPINFFYWGVERTGNGMPYLFLVWCERWKADQKVVCVFEDPFNEPLTCLIDCEYVWKWVSSILIRIR